MYAGKHEDRLSHEMLPPMLHVAFSDLYETLRYFDIFLTRSNHSHLKRYRLEYTSQNLILSFKPSSGPF